MGAAETIVICEPQCRDYEHSRLNAALAETVLRAFPGAHILFIAESSHMTRVRALLEARAGELLTRIEWRATEIPPRHAPGRRRIRTEWRVIGEALGAQTGPGALYVLFTSATEIGLFLLKLRLLVRPQPAPVLAILHGLLSTIVPGAPRKPLAALRGMRLVFRLPHPRALRYVALGASILESLREIHPRAARATVAFELPFTWTVETLPAPPAVPPVVFGYFGVSGGRGKGFDAFVALARTLREEFPGARFVMVGHLSTEADRARFAGTGEEFPSRPLTADEYAARAREVTYAVALGDPAVYRVGASTSFLDALAGIKPGIYLRNAYLDSCFRRMGDIGYLCGSPDEVLACMRAVLREFPAERYAAQCRTIFTARRMFEPASLSGELPGIINGIRRVL
ncbi:MAG TPA: hypothetical protein VMM80_09775 [Bacteroidota bacterium]|nr:hypothetical protein [Bacteroidota bacterium]